MWVDLDLDVLEDDDEPRAMPWLKIYLWAFLLGVVLGAVFGPLPGMQVA